MVHEFKTHADVAIAAFRLRQRRAHRQEIIELVFWALLTGTLASAAGILVFGI